MKILGIHASYNALNHDPSATLLIDGKIISAMEEERFNRVKTSVGYFPYYSIKNILSSNALNIKDIDLVVSTGETYPLLKKKIRKSLIHSFGYSPKIVLMNHALAHAYGAYYSSGFDKSLVISIDALGDKISLLVVNASKNKFKTTYKSGQGKELESIGCFYASFTEYLGFRRSEGEFKLMGMAAYGKRKINLDKIIKIRDNPFKVNVNPKLTTENKIPVTSTFDPMVNIDFLKKTLDGKPMNEKKYKQNHFDLALSVQTKYEEILLKIVKKFKGVHKNLCLSGGCALNCLANSYLSDLFENIYIMPAASDRGLSLGCAYYGAKKNGVKTYPTRNMFLGRSYSELQIKKFLDMSGISYKKCNADKNAAKDLVNGRIVGWFKGRSEFGPRALGGRSILALAKIKGIKNKINSKIKFREKFRPFAPVTLKSFAEKFGIKKDFPYMTIASFPNKKFSEKLGESLHKDGSIRLQTVSEKQHPLYKLLKELEKNKYAPVLINTSFNTSGEPIVESPKDAIRTFFSSGLDVLYIENFRITKLK